MMRQYLHELVLLLKTADDLVDIDVNYRARHISLKSLGLRVVLDS